MGGYWPVWLFLALAAAVTAVPSAAATRVGALAGGGRLLAHPSTAVRRRVATPSTTAATVLGAGAIVVSLAVTTGLPLAVAAGSIVGAAGVLARDARRSRTAVRRQRELLTAIGVLAAELAAGATPATALGAAAGTSDAIAAMLAPAAAAAVEGRDAASLLMAEPDDGVRAIGLAWRLVETTGAGLTGVIDRVAADLADRDTQRRTAAVVLAGPRSSALLLSLLPVVGIAMGTAMGAAPVPFLLDDPIGRWLCCVGVLLDVAGLLWIRRIVRGAETL